MLKLFLLAFFSSSLFSYQTLAITGLNSFDYFASLLFWLLIISAPVFLVISLLKYARRAFQ